MHPFYDYIGLIEKFLNREITVQEFEKTFNDAYRAEKLPMSDELFDCLDWLFAEIDDYTDLPMEPEDDPDDYRTEEQLRESAAKTLNELRELQSLGRPLTRPI